MTLKFKSRVTGGHWKRNHWIDHYLLSVESFDVEYYRDLEIWVRGHSRSLKMVPFESFGMVSYSNPIVTIAVSLAISQIYLPSKSGLTLTYGLGVVQGQLKWRGSVDHVPVGQPL